MSAWVKRADGTSVEVEGSFSFGRTLQNSLMIDDRSVSRRHAMINRDEAGALWLVDMGSSNGVLHNGLRIRQPVQLREGDHIEICGHHFSFFLGERPPAVPVPQLEESTTVTLAAVRTIPTWLLVADVVNSTQLNKTQAAEQAAAVIGEWFKNCQILMRKHSAEVNKHLGDGFLAFWPAPATQPAEVLAAIRELKELQQVSAVPFRFAIHFGRVMVDSAVSRGEDSLLGPEVNFIFRMEKLAATLSVPCLVSGAAAEELKVPTELVSKGRHLLAGFEGGFEFFVA